MSDRLPSLNALRAFDETARTLSVTRAAEALHVTHGAVSRQLKQLEEQLGVALFRRQGRGLSLTQDGELLRASTSQAFERLGQACTQLRRRASEAPLVLGCPGSFLARWFIPRLDRLKAQCPELNLHLTADEEVAGRLGTDVDAVLRFAEPPWPDDMRVVELAPERIGPVLAPELLDAPSHIPPGHDTAALTSLPMLHTQSRPQAWSQWFAAQGLDPATMRHDQSFEHLHYMLEAALVGLGVAIAPSYLVEEDLRTGRLVAPWGFIETPARLGLWLPPGAPRRDIERLVEWLAQELAHSTG
ncbi:LysR family transcriptional regulator [Halomonas organivorans]|uniref:DNA-binding transcriptional LysR family regulator n=1 Tax=Halomonas organivorans TaxID=257772 RepID=A0A7W5BUR0_9GAMM|nr:LysR family transcriptional regulator [Halomonas organivorans]MBB3139469.1 DNA-binding transcriptional LysR family regulator [Halomonas organivorans]